MDAVGFFIAMFLFLGGGLTGFGLGYSCGREDGVNDGYARGANQKHWEWTNWAKNKGVLSILALCLFAAGCNPTPQPTPPVSSPPTPIEPSATILMERDIKVFKQRVGRQQQARMYESGRLIPLMIPIRPGEKIE